MENVIKFKSQNKSFISFLKSKGMTEKGKYLLKTSELKQYFDFKEGNDDINISVSLFNRFLKIKRL